MHEWTLLPDPLPVVPGFLNSRKNDVHVCQRCHQIAITGIWASPDTSSYPVKDCDESVVRQVLES